MSEQEKKDPILEKLTDRRTFIKNSGLTVGGLILGGALGSAIGGQTKTITKEVQVPAAVEMKHEVHDHSEALLFFTRKEDFDAMAAATEQIFPEDEHGAGAIKLGAPFYIDKQLASPWGRNVDDYMKRPFKNGATPLNRGDIVLQGVRKLNEESQQRHKNMFNQLTEEEQIAILQDFEVGKVEMKLVSSAVFFGLLRQLTIEGCYCDPMHGGNKNMEGWNMKEFPGAYMSYTDVIESKEFIKKVPISLSNHLNH